MEKVWIRKQTLLEFVLLIASIITTTIMPSEENTKLSKYDQGSLTLESEPGVGDVSSITCAVDTFEITALCEYLDDDDGDDPVNSETSEDSGPENSTSNSSTGIPDGVGQGNTSDGS